MTFTAATYNVLATAYIRRDYYPAVPADLLGPARRVPAVVRHVAGLGADVLCLQEVEPEVFAALQGGLGPLGYAGRYEQKGHGRPDGCATFYRGTAFALRQARRLEYQDRERGPGGDSGFVALLLALEHQGRLLGVANTHLRWDPPGRPPHEQVGYRQAEQLLQECVRFRPACDGWLLCGDFNRTPGGEVVARLRQAGFAFAHAGRPHARSAVANGRAVLIDYLFHSGGLRARPADPPPVTDATALPAPDQPSDHLALLAEFAWATPAGPR